MYCSLIRLCLIVAVMHVPVCKAGMATHESIIDEAFTLTFARTCCVSSSNFAHRHDAHLFELTRYHFKWNSNITSL